MWYRTLTRNFKEKQLIWTTAGCHPPPPPPLGRRTSTSAPRASVHAVHGHPFAFAQASRSAVPRKSTKLEDLDGAPRRLLQVPERAPRPRERGASGGVQLLEHELREEVGEPLQQVEQRRKVVVVVVVVVVTPG
jgi:hypothetical protein